MEPALIKHPCGHSVPTAEEYGCGAHVPPAAPLHSLSETRAVLPILHCDAERSYVFHRFATTLLASMQSANELTSVPELHEV